MDDLFFLEQSQCSFDGIGFLFDLADHLRQVDIHRSEKCKISVNILHVSQQVFYQLLLPSLSKDEPREEWENICANSVVSFRNQRSFSISKYVVMNE